MTQQENNQELPAGEERQNPSPGLWRKILTWTVRSCLVLLVVVTVLITAGRILTSMIPARQSTLENELGALLGTDVSIGAMDAGWERLGPVIEISNLRIINPDDPAASHVITNLFIKPDLLDSVLTGSLVINQVIVQRPDVQLRENPDGSWMLAGLQGGGSSGADNIIDFLLATGRMRIIEAGLTLRWADGRELELDNIYIDLSNSGNRHLSQVQGRISGQSSPFQLQLEFNGDPREQFSGSAFLHTSQLELSSLISIPELELDVAEITGDFWLSVRQGRLFNVQAAVQSLNIEGSGSQESTIRELSLGSASMTLTVRHDSGSRWQAWLDDAEFDWQNRPWNAGSIYMDYQQVDQNRPMRVNAARLDLAMVRDLLDDLIELPPTLVDVLNDLQPQGQLANLELNTNLNGDFEGGFLLQGNLEDIAVEAWQGAPSGRGIQGYVEANSVRGFVEMDSKDFEIHLPLLFDDPWHYDSANSRIKWQIQDDIIRINSGIIDVSNDVAHGHVQFDFLNYLNSSGERLSELTLLIGLLEVDAAYKSLYLPRLENIQGTMDWLDEALLAGNITNSGFVSRTTIPGNAQVNSGTVLSFYNVEGGALKFQPQWPELTGIDAFITIDNDQSDVIAEKAVIEGITLDRTLASVLPNPAGGSMVTVTGSADTNTDVGLAFLRNTPVRENIGDFIDSWQATGNLQVDMELAIPLNNPGQNTDIQLSVLSNMSTLVIPDYSLTIDTLRGRIEYTSEDGLSASALSGMLFDFPIAATIESLVSEDSDAATATRGTRIVGSGRASQAALQSWEGQSEFVRKVLNFASGEIDYLAEIIIPPAQENTAIDEGTRIRLTSELLGLSLDLPRPFNKTVDNIRELELLINFSDSQEWVSARFDNKVGANLQISGDEFTGGRVVFGPDARQMNFGPVALQGPGLYFSGYLESFDYSDWEEAATRFSQMSSGSDNNQATLDDFITRADVNVGLLTVMGQDLEDVQTQVSRLGESGEDSEAGAGLDSESWQVNLANHLLSGILIFPDAPDLPWDITLDYLRFPETEELQGGADDGEQAEAQEEVDMLAEINPAELSDLNFSTKEFTIGDKHLGAWEFVLRTTNNAATISELKMTTPDASIRDLSGDTGANLDWRYLDGIHTSSFTGLFSAGDLARVLPGWGYDANVESESAAFVSNLQWEGSPAAFDLKKVVGTVGVDIREGRFVNVDSGTSRLFGAFSFDSLVRRLQLDFSDLYERGLAYDEIQGNLDFNRGIVKTAGGFEINGPSSQITINGQINLIRQTIDADMLVNVPLSQNISVLAAILGGWPVAVSAYIAGRIFKDQMDEFTTILYRLDGPWENPSSGFEPTEEILEAAQVPTGGSAEAGVNPP